MGVVIRLSRHGSKKRPFYRVVAADARMPRDGRYLEIVGTYDPRKAEKQCTWKADKVTYWLSKGALPSETVGQLLKREPIAANAN
jgi:small subunit ribosomal protein S16